MRFLLFLGKCGPNISKSSSFVPRNTSDLLLISHRMIRGFFLFGWFRTIARKYYVHIAVEPCIDTDLENDHARITCFKISSIAVYPYKKQGLSLFLSTIALFFDKFKLLVDYYKIEGVMNKKILRSLLNDGWRKRNDADIYDTTLYKKVE